MVGLARAARVNEKLGDCIQAHARDPRHGAQAVAFAEQSEDGGALGRGELVHGEDDTSPCLSGQA